MAPYEPDEAFVLGSEEQLRSLYKPTHGIAAIKSLDRLDKHAEEFIRRSPFMCLGTQDRDGKADVSPRGDPAGFVEILDERTLAIPDRPGNNRLDSLSNIVANPNVGLLFMVPGFDETLRINGKARLVTDPELLVRMQVNGRTPTLAILVQVDEVFLHCAKAFRRSRLWDPAAQQDRSTMPSLMHMLLDQTSGVPEDEAEMRQRDEDLEASYKRSMY